ncbi:MAG: nucleotidyltransferase family protein [Candidatus Omnitrophota bacterium]
MENEVIDLRTVKAYLLEKEKRDKQRCRNELKSVLKKLKSLAPLWKKYNLEKVYLYGSLTGFSIHSGSDIDIALEGDIDYANVLSLFGEVDRQFSREVDLRRIEELPFKEAVQKKGLVVYEK